MAENKEERLPDIRETDDGGFEVDVNPPEETRRERAEQAPQDNTARDAAMVRAAVEGARAVGNQTQQRDELAEAEREIHDRQRSLGVEFEVHRASKTLSAEKAEAYDKQARELNQKLADISAQRAVRGVIPQLMQAQEQKHYQTLYSDVHSNPNALRYARARFEMLAARGEPQSPQLVEKAMNDARAQFGLAGVSRAPSDSDRAKYTGASGSASSRGGAPRVKLGKSEQSMAMAMYGDKVNGDEKKAYALWAKGPGSKALKELNKRSSQG